MIGDNFLRAKEKGIRRLNIEMKKIGEKYPVEPGQHTVPSYL